MPPLREAAETDDARGALESVGFGPHRLEVGGGGRETGGDHVAAPFRLFGEGLQELLVGGGFLVHRAIALSTASRINLRPKAPSTVSRTMPLRC